MTLYKQLLAAIATLLSLAFTLSIALAFEHFLSFNIFGLMMWFVLPVGAFMVGIGSGCGYYFASKFLHLRPTWSTALVTFVLAIGAQLALYFGRYMLEEVDGTPVRELVGFFEYTRIYLGSQTFGLARHASATVELGLWGYLLAVIQLFGLLAGTMLLYFFLTIDPWCATCERFLAKVGEYTHKLGDDDTLARALQSAPLSQEHTSILRESQGTGPSSLGTLIYGCSQCGRGFIRQTPTPADTANFSLAQRDVESATSAEALQVFGALR